MRITIWTLLYAITTVSAAASRNLQSSTPRTQTPLSETTPRHEIVEPNATDFYSDTRTPPRIKQMMKKAENKLTIIENSHPGIAEPVDEESVNFQDDKKMNFYKLENKPTTDGGLSTWILLSGQTISSTAKPFKNNIKPLNETRNVTMINRIVKPVFKKRPTSTTAKPTTTPTPVSRKTTTIKEVTTTTPKATTTESVVKLTKVKASVLNNAITSKNTTLVTMATLEAKYEKKKEDSLKVKTTTTTTESSIKIIDSADLKPELKVGDLDLTPTSTTVSPKKSRRPPSKKNKKKDKNRRRRPTAEDKNDNQNKTKVATKDKPISTQIYNYLAREVMPTVGVGLVGLVVTAGLASYFLYPFGALRRSSEIDRKDTYYYENDYSGGVPEEEAIGKVIAGMPLANEDYRPQTYKNQPYNANRYRYADSGYSNAHTSVEAVQLDPVKDYKTDYLQDIYQSNEVHKNEPITYNKDQMSQNVEAGYMASDQQYVVGNIPKEVQEVTPAAVPEHGPRSLKLRRRRRGVVETNMVERDYNPKILLDKIKRAKLSQSNAKLAVRV